MTGKVKLFWCLYGIVLIFLFVLSSTDWIIKEEKSEIYPISVIIEDTADDNYVNFRKGMERAALELNADVSFITLYEQGNREQQRELILREQQDGSRALIVTPVTMEMIAQMQEENLITVPLVLVNAEMTDIVKREDTGWIAFDYYGMGRTLGEAILGEQPSCRTVWLLGRGNPNLASRSFSEGARDALKSEGCELLSFVWQSEEDLSRIFEKLTEDRTQRAVIVATDPESLIKTAQFLADADETAEWIGGLYGRGNTVPILNYLDRGLIQGLCITDDFSAGYLSVKTAVELADKHYVPERGYLESCYIQREDLRNEKYEKLLYPIE